MSRFSDPTIFWQFSVGVIRGEMLMTLGVWILFEKPNLFYLLFSATKMEHCPQAAGQAARWTEPLSSRRHLHMSETLYILLW